MIHSHQCVSIYQPLKNERKKYTNQTIVKQKNSKEIQRSHSTFILALMINLDTHAHAQTNTFIQLSNHSIRMEQKSAQKILHCIATNTSEAKITIVTINRIKSRDHLFFLLQTQPILFKCITITTSNVLIILFYLIFF